MKTIVLTVFLIGATVGYLIGLFHQAEQKKHRMKMELVHNGTK